MSPYLVFCKVRTPLQRDTCRYRVQNNQLAEGATFNACAVRQAEPAETLLQTP